MTFCKKFPILLVDLLVDPGMRIQQEDNFQEIIESIAMIKRDIFHNKSLDEMFNNPLFCGYIGFMMQRPFTKWSYGFLHEIIWKMEDNLPLSQKEAIEQYVPLLLSYYIIIITLSYSSVWYP